MTCIDYEKAKFQFLNGQKREAGKNQDGKEEGKKEYLREVKGAEKGKAKV